MEQTVNDTLDFTEEEVATSKPEEKVEETTVEETEEQQTDNADTEETVENSEDKTDEQNETVDEDEAFIKSKALDPSDPTSLKKMAAMYRNAEKLMGEKSQEAARLSRMMAEQHMQKDGEKVEPTDVLHREVQTLKNNEAIRDFRSRVNPTPEIEAKMSEYLQAPLQLPNGQIASRGQLVMSGMMTLDDVYRLVGGGQVDPTQIKEQVRKQTLAEVANKQKAARLSSTSTDQTAFSKDDPYDNFLSGLK